MRTGLQHKWICKTSRHFLASDADACVLCRLFARKHPAAAHVQTRKHHVQRQYHHVQTQAIPAQDPRSFCWTCCSDAALRIPLVSMHQLLCSGFAYHTEIELRKDSVYDAVHAHSCDIFAEHPTLKTSCTRCKHVLMLSCA